MAYNKVMPLLDQCGLTVFTREVALACRTEILFFPGANLEGPPLLTQVSTQTTNTPVG